MTNFKIFDGPHPVWEGGVVGFLGAGLGSLESGFKPWSIKPEDLFDLAIAVGDGTKRYTHLAAEVDHGLGGYGVFINIVIGILDRLVVEPPPEHMAVGAGCGTVDCYFHTILLTF